MRLKSIELTNYRKYEQLGPVDFPDGLVGIFGPNGSGKSTLIEAVAWALYGNAAARTDRTQIKRQGAGPLEPCRVVLELEHGGSEYRVVREMRGRSLTAEATVSAGREPVASSARETERYLARLLGMDRESFFTSFFAKQKELDALSDLRPAERRRLIIRMLGIDDIDRAIELLRADGRTLEGRIEALRETARPETIAERRGELEALSAEVSEIERDLGVRRQALTAARAAAGSAKEAFEAVMARRKTYEELATRYTETTAQLTNARDAAEGLQREIESLKSEQRRVPALAKAARDFDKMKARRDEMERLHSAEELAAERRDQIGRIGSRLAAIQGRLAELSSPPEKRAQLEHEAELAEAALAGLRQNMDDALAAEARASAGREHAQGELDALLEQRAKWTELGPESTCPTCLRPLGEDYESIRSHFEQEESTLRERLCGLETQGGEAGTAREAAKAGIQATQEQVSSLRATLGELQQRDREASTLRDERAGLLEASAGLESRLEEVKAGGYDAQAHQQLLQRLEELSAARDEYLQLTGNLERLPALEGRLSETQERVAGLEKTLEEVQAEGEALAFSHEEFDKARLDNESAQASAHQADIATKEFEHKLGLAESAANALRKNVAELEAQRERLDRDAAEREMLHRLELLLGRFRTHLIGRIRPALAAKAGRLISELTAGRYAEIELDEDYQIYVYDDGEKFGIDRFSGGEKDLANLSLRLAISQQIAETAGDELGFIVLDEIFGSQDRERRGDVMKALAALSNQFRQVFVITHIEDIKDQMQYALMVSEDEDGTARAVLE